jgi:hypothetical protein
MERPVALDMTARSKPAEHMVRTTFLIPKILNQGCALFRFYKPEHKVAHLFRNIFINPLLIEQKIVH